MCSGRRLNRLSRFLTAGGMTLVSIYTLRPYRNTMTRKIYMGGCRCGRAFGGNAARVAIVFKVPLSLTNAGVFNLIFSPVAYLTEPEIAKQFHTVVANIEANCDFLKSIGHSRTVTSIFNMLVAGVTCLKHEGFKEEREWRPIYAPKRWPSPLIDSSTEVVGGIPQIVYRIPLNRAVSDALGPFDLANIFDHLIIGPSLYPWSCRKLSRLCLRTRESLSLRRRFF